MRVLHRILSETSINILGWRISLLSFFKELYLTKKIKNFNNNLINYVFAVSVYDLFLPCDKFIDTVPPNITHFSFKEVVELVFDVILTVQGNTFHLIQH